MNDQTLSTEKTEEIILMVDIKFIMSTKTESFYWEATLTDPIESKSRTKTSRNFTTPEEAADNILKILGYALVGN